MHIKISDELRPYIDPLTASEYAALERSILAEGCRDALVLWGDVLVDGHNRYAICKKHGIAFSTVQKDGFAAIEDVMLWMIDNHLARRSVSDFQRGMLALRKKAILTARAPAAEEPAAAASAAVPSAAGAALEPPLLHTREDVAKAAGISSNTISRIEKIQKTAAPELVEAVRSGTISLNAATAVATLPSEEQVAAVAAGKKELQQVAKQVREAKSSPKQPKAEARCDTMEPRAEVTSLTVKIDALTAENAALKAQVAALTAELENVRQAAQP
jgi:ParB-like chromosome segregation protein Spo0J